MYNVTAIQLFSDNYAWRLDTPDGRAVLVDPADAKACLAALNTVALAGVLSTHYHHDHAGDNEALARAVPGLMIVGGFDEGTRVPALTRAVRDGDSVDIGGLHFECLHTPCHTRGHIIYYIPSGSDGTPGSLFTGDTLFAGGCGRFFEGGPAEMLAALSRLALLPSDTRIFCGHEYTVANLQFCLHVEPDNDATAARLAEAVALRAAGLPRSLARLVWSSQRTCSCALE